MKIGWNSKKNEHFLYFQGRKHDESFAQLVFDIEDMLQYLHASYQCRFSSFYPFPRTSMQWFLVYKAKSIHCPLSRLRGLP
jgi:hypothetical protein